MKKKRELKLFGFTLKKCGFILLLFWFSFCNIKAQDRLEIGLMAGTSYYLGDLNPHKQFYKPSLAYGGIARYVLTDRFAVKGSATLMKIKGEESFGGASFPNGDGNYSFKRNIGDVALQMEFNFRSYDHPFIKTTTFTPYVSFGVGTAIYQRISSDLENNSEQMVFILSLPIGVGFKYKINNWIRVGAEWSFRKTFVDDLDIRIRSNIPFEGTEDPYGFEGGTTIHNNDLYSFAGVMVTFSMFRRKTECKSGY